MLAVVFLQFCIFVIVYSSENKNTQINGEHNQNKENLNLRILTRVKRERKSRKNKKKHMKERSMKKYKTRKNLRKTNNNVNLVKANRKDQKRKFQNKNRNKTGKNEREKNKRGRKNKKSKTKKKRKSKRHQSKEGEENQRKGGRALSGDSCQWLDFGTARARGANCADGTKMVIQNKKGVRKQFLLTNEKTIYGFATKGEKLADCSSLTEITDSIVCKEVEGLSSISLSGSSRAVEALIGRQAFIGKACEWIDINQVRTSGQGCADGSKFVISKEKGTRKQFLLVEGKDIIAFVKSGEKFVDCSAFTEVTSQVSCKAVAGVDGISLTGGSAPSPTPASSTGKIL